MPAEQIIPDLSFPHENVRRIEQGLAALIRGNEINFATQNTELVVLFDVPATRFGAGRILLFQQFIEQKTGVIPIVIRQVPACIKVFFDYPYQQADRDHLLDMFKSSEFHVVYQSLRIKQVQFAGQLVFAHLPK